MTGTTGASLVAIDLQRVFADPGSAWATPRFAEALTGTRRLATMFEGRTVLTRFVAPERPVGAWVPYYEAWPDQLRPPEDAMWDLVEGLPDGTPVVSSPTFGKWGPALAAVAGDDLVLTGVSTDCCVLSTALAAADAGARVRVVADACAGASDADHRRALEAMALYAPLVSITSVEEVLGDSRP